MSIAIFIGLLIPSAPEAKTSKLEPSRSDFKTSTVFWLTKYNLLFDVSTQIPYGLSTVALSKISVILPPERPEDRILSGSISAQ